MKREMIDFQPDVSIQPSDQVSAQPAESRLPDRTVSINSLAYSAVMVSMFFAIVAFMVMIILDL